MVYCHLWIRHLSLQMFFFLSSWVLDSDAGSGEQENLLTSGHTEQEIPPKSISMGKFCSNPTLIPYFTAYLLQFGRFTATVPTLTSTAAQWCYAKEVDLFLGIGQRMCVLLFAVRGVYSSSADPLLCDWTSEPSFLVWIHGSSCHHSLGCGLQRGPQDTRHTHSATSSSLFSALLVVTSWF